MNSSEKSEIFAENLLTSSEITDILKSSSEITDNDRPQAGKDTNMKNITFQTNEQLWKIENAVASAGYRKTDDCYWAQIFRNEETGHEFSTSREENSTNDPAADLVAMLTPAEETPAEEEQRENILDRVAAELEARKDRSAWDKGVTVYALELVEELKERAVYEGRNPEPGAECRKWMLNGAQDWAQYSWGGSSLIYDCDIAERLCTPSELKKTRHGERRPNSREEWLDTQARALYQACNRVARVYCSIVTA